MLDIQEGALQPKLDMSPEQSIKVGSKSFALASLFLPRSSRKDALLLYRWLRNFDDLIDEAPNLETARKRLESLESSDPLLPRWMIPEWVNPRHQAEFLAGLRMDVETVSYQSVQDLELYCFRVAGVVGLMMCPVIGADPEHAPPHATALGVAMQLSNIARDIQADAQMGRVYVPSELLTQTSACELASNPEKAFPAVQVLLDRADEWYQEGFRGIKWLPLRTAFAIAVAGLLYQKIGHKLLTSAEKNPVAAFRQRTVVSKSEKFTAVLKALCLVVKIKCLSPKPALQGDKAKELFSRFQN